MSRTQMVIEVEEKLKEDFKIISVRKKISMNRILTVFIERFVIKNQDTLNRKGEDYAKR